MKANSFENVISYAGRDFKSIEKLRTILRQPVISNLDTIFPDIFRIDRILLRVSEKTIYKVFQTLFVQSFNVFYIFYKR